MPRSIWNGTIPAVVRMGEGDDADARQELSDLSRDELYERAQREGVRGRTKMSKKELVDALAGE